MSSYEDLAPVHDEHEQVLGVCVSLLPLSSDSN